MCGVRGTLSNMHTHMTILAHRGASGEEPENTMRAFRRAHALGCRWIECDVRMTKDGVPVIIHDAIVNRTTNGRGAVSQIPYHDLRKLDAGKGEAMPSLKELILFAKKYSMRLVLEIKDPHALNTTLTCLHTHNYSHQVIISSLTSPVLRRAHALNPSLAAALIIARPQTHWIRAAQRARVRIIHVKSSLVTKKKIKNARDAGLGVWGWTVNTPQEAARLVRFGIQGIFTDHPQYFLQSGHQGSTPIV